jgi:acetyl esterase/lipase
MLSALALLLGTGHAAAAPRPQYLVNVHYGAGPSRVLDIGRPAAPAGSRHPAVVFIHGGGWAAGGKGDWRFALPRIVARGWVAFSIDYRFTPPDAFPAPLTDTLAALRWIHRNASTFGVDPQRIAVVGDSAGAHLALLAAESRRAGVAAAVAWSAPTDLAALVRSANRPVAEAVVHFVGCVPAACPARYASISPVDHVGASTAPTLLMNSTREIIPLGQAEHMSARLRAAHVPYELAVFEGTGHGRDYTQLGWPRTIRFLLRHLR